MPSLRVVLAEDVPVDIRRTLMGPCTAELKEIYLELGLQVSSLSGELPDHIAIELEAMAYALSFDETEPMARRLFDKHLAQWLPRLCGPSPTRPKAISTATSLFSRSTG